MVRVGLVGCGTIGSQLAVALDRRFARVARITALHDVQTAHALRLQRRLSSHPAVVSLPTLLRTSRLVIEAASVDAARRVFEQALRLRRDVFLMSVGALLNLGDWQAQARRRGISVYLPSGALAGLDGVKAMAVGTIRRAALTTRKPPRALAAAPYVRRKRLSLARLTKPTVIFEGTPRQVVRAFPQNANVAAALRLAAGRAGGRARIRVVADPALTRNVHELEVVGDCGRIRCQIESRPSANPKTSELAVRSAIATLAQVFDPVSIGT